MNKILDDLRATPAESMPNLNEVDTAIAFKWAWGLLRDPRMQAMIPPQAREAWRTMLAERSTSALNAAATLIEDLEWADGSPRQGALAASNAAGAMSSALLCSDPTSSLEKVAFEAREAADAYTVYLQNMLRGQEAFWGDIVSYLGYLMDGADIWGEDDIWGA